jgi:hypothetical protein
LRSAHSRRFGDFRLIRSRTHLQTSEIVGCARRMIHDDLRVWAITESDRSVTTILLPQGD